MGLREQILDNIKSAMKEKKQPTVDALRYLNAAIKNREFELGPTKINDFEVVGVIKKLVKQRQDSIEQYQKGGREDLVKKESFELELLKKYLPEQLNPQQVEALVKEVITFTNASSMKDMGSVMKEVTARSQGRADNKLLSEIVKGFLQK